jgi:hypothetical protein
VAGSELSEFVAHDALDLVDGSEHPVRGVPQLLLGRLHVDLRPQLRPHPKSLGTASEVEVDLSTCEALDLLMGLREGGENLRGR